MLFAEHTLSYGWVPWQVCVGLAIAALLAILAKEQYKVWLAGGLLVSMLTIVLAFNEAHVVVGHILAPEALLSLTFVGVMFYIYEYAGHSFLVSGVAERLTEWKWLRANFGPRINWCTFFPSGLVDNVAAGKMSKKVIQAARDNKELEIDDAAGIICASNAGGAGSPVGDTTTIMIVTQVLVKTGNWWLVFAAYPTCIVYQIVINWFMPKGPLKKAEVDPGDELYAPRQLDLYKLWPLLAIVGLVAGIITSTLWPEPASHDLRGRYLREAFPLAGLVSGFVIGLLMARLTGPRGAEAYQVDWHVLCSHPLAENTAFILALLAAFHYEPMGEVVEGMAWMPLALFVFIMAVLSGILDNIALTQALILMAVASGNTEAYPWALIAYGVGVGGNLLWLGSSSGVNVTMPEEGQDHEGQEENEVRKMKHWLGWGGWTWKAMFALTVGFLFHLAFWWWGLGIRI